MYVSGTTPGANDMVAFYSVGVVNHVALHNLQLTSGHEYYATVIGWFLTLGNKDRLYKPSGSGRI